MGVAGQMIRGGGVGVGGGYQRGSGCGGYQRGSGCRRGLPEGEWVLRGGYQRGSWCRRGLPEGELV